MYHVAPFGAISSKGAKRGALGHDLKVKLDIQELMMKKKAFVYINVKSN